jgi:transcriptional regulator with XRE-family HTH domain
MAMPEKNLSHIKPLILNGTIRVFEDIFEHASVIEVAEAMGCGRKQVAAIQRDHSVMTLGQLFGLSEGIGLPWRKAADLFCE